MATIGNLEKTLHSLRDLDGVVGSFVIGSNGEVIVQDLPSYFGSSAREVAPRALRFMEALNLATGEVSHSVLHYGSHKLMLRPLQAGMLASIFASQINMPALRMAVNLIARKLDQEGLEDSSIDALTSAPASTPAPATARSSPQARDEERRHARGAPEASGGQRSKNRPIYFRGKRVQ
jgi:predicted regulator of Ras-like GTPase activity (Roadblock/LC7/MglB family)